MQQNNRCIESLKIEIINSSFDPLTSRAQNRLHCQFLLKPLETFEGKQGKRPQAQVGTRVVISPRMLEKRYDG